MAGGLISIISYGSQDIFLSGSPDITFFKIVYRRHTNFAVESIRVKSDNDVNFGTETTYSLPRIGDLLHKICLEITLPELKFTRTTSSESIQNYQSQYDQYIDEYNTTQQFMELNMNAYREAIEIYNLNNVSDPGEMISAISAVFDGMSGSGSGSDMFDINMFYEILENTTLVSNSPIINKYIVAKFFYQHMSLKYIADNSTYTDKEILKSALDYAVKLSKLIIEYWQWLISDTKKKLDDAKNTNYKLAWTKRIAHSMVNYVDITVGGILIDKHYGQWIDILYEITKKDELEPAYMKMIGNISELTTFDRTTKPKTVLLLPLSFWFCRFTGQSIPMVALEYSDVQLHLKLRNFSQLAYIENVGRSFNLDDMFENEGYQVSVNLLCDYVFLDKLERNKFAQSSHEYLIDIIQTQIDDSKHELFKTRVEFTNPSREIIWIAQRNSVLSNPTGTTECQWCNYGIYKNELGNPFAFNTFKIHSHDLFHKNDSIYYNNVTSFYNHSAIPKDGVNLMSFAVMPEENQPCGSINLSRITLAQLISDIDKKMLIEENTELNEMLTVMLFSVSQNIFRVLKGFGNLAFA